MKSIMNKEILNKELGEIQRKIRMWLFIESQVILTIALFICISFRIIEYEQLFWGYFELTLILAFYIITNFLYFKKILRG